MRNGNCENNKNTDAHTPSSESSHSHFATSSALHFSQEHCKEKGRRKELLGQKQDTSKGRQPKTTSVEGDKTNFLAD